MRGHELAHLDRLHQVVVGADLQAQHLLVYRFGGGEDQHRHVVAALAQAAQHGLAAQPRDVEIEQHHVVACLLQQAVGRMPLGHVIDHEVLRRKSPASQWASSALSSISSSFMRLNSREGRPGPARAGLGNTTRFRGSGRKPGERSRFLDSPRFIHPGDPFMRKPQLHRNLIVGAAFALAASFAGMAQAAEPIVIMVGGINKIIYLPAKLTEALGYFKDEGLNVELQSQPAGVDAENQLIAGAVQGRGGLLRPHHRPAEQGQGDPGDRGLRQGAGRGRAGLDQGCADLQDHGRCQGQDPGRDRPRLLDRLPHPLPGRPPGRGAEGLFAAARGRRQHLRRRDEAGPHPGGA